MLFESFHSGYLQTGTLANSEDRDFIMVTVCEDENNLQGQKYTIFKKF